ncbi:riboflavin synthase subunit alpha [Reinekea marinisedimentorum]|uniref:Riboflavin synthase n=1 Tax=Reinekea marinisedimentorum TaxID=230495 RepID=A0A4R3HXP3_9GAMM|nr:riboflavin synthase subunit alpha [Reinekea marinisedimentorum]TCS37614.1 riboflavin synthase [Reinekea marinisedimentorum]
MFTGIVQNKANVRVERSENQLKTFSIELTEKQEDGLSIGGSIALNGVCLTVTKVENSRAFFDVMMETLRATNLGQLQDGDAVNVERAAKFGDDIGGHAVSGHVSSTVKVVEIQKPENNCIIWFEISPEQRKYLFNKGFVSLNGCSLTIGEVEDDRFNIYLIPETLAVTTFGEMAIGTAVNIEYDANTQAIVDTLTRMKQEGAL